MEFSSRCHQILFLLLVTIFMAQAMAVVTSKYKKIEPGQNITGTSVAEFTTRSKLQCSDRLVELSSTAIL